MTRPNMHTATFKGGTHTLPQNGWQRLTGRSRTFLCNMMQEAADKGIDINKRMQYAIEQEPGGHRMSRKSVDGNGHKRTHQERVRVANASSINQFLYGR